RRGPESWLLVVNAGNTPKDFAWARDRAGQGVELVDASERYALLAVQGPRAGLLVGRAASEPVTDLPYYGFKTVAVLGAPVLVSPTGYTGEDGFEIYLEPVFAERVFRGLLAAGADLGVLPCGLGARDTLRLEAKMCLYGNDIDDTVTAWEADLGWIVKM